MYDVLLQTREDILRNRPAVKYHNIRTLSFTSSRILLTDDENKMYCFHPSKISLIAITTEVPPVHGMSEDDNIKYNVDELFEVMQKTCEQFNKMFGTNFSVRLMDGYGNTLKNQPEEVFIDEEK